MFINHIGQLEMCTLRFILALSYKLLRNKITAETQQFQTEPSDVCLKSGVARGCGWQDLGAYVNLATYYLCGIPFAAALGFCLHLKGPGLWIGIQAGALLQTVLLLIITKRTDWEKQVYPTLNLVISAICSYFTYCWICIL